MFDKRNKKKITGFSVRKEQLIVPDGPTIIAEKAFQGQKYLKTIEISNSIEEIEKKAFAYCFNLSTINIPENIKILGPSVFYHCESLKDIKFLATDPNKIKVSRTLFYLANIENCTLWVPSGSEDLYRNHKVFGAFKIIKGLE